MHPPEEILWAHHPSRVLCWFRVVCTDHGHFVLLNVYVPNAGGRPDRPRLAAKLAFLQALTAKADALVAEGREVMQA